MKTTLIKAALCSATGISALVLASSAYAQEAAPTPEQVEQPDAATSAPEASENSETIIGTGSRVSTPPIPGLAETPFWTSDEVLDLDRTPESVIVLGGGIVACELAQYLRRIGARVTVIQRSDHVLRDHSPEAAAVVEDAFRANGGQEACDACRRQVGGRGRGTTMRGAEEEE